MAIGTLLVLNVTSLNSINALLALGRRYQIKFSKWHSLVLLQMQFTATKPFFHPCPLPILATKAPPQNCYVALSWPTVKCEKTGSFFLFCCCCCCWKYQIWAKNLLKFVFNGLKKHLYICVLTAFCPSFPHLETLNFFLENSTLSRYVKKKKKKKKNRPTDPIFRFWSGEGNITIFFFWPNTEKHLPEGNFEHLSKKKKQSLKSDIFWYCKTEDAEINW